MPRIGIGIGIGKSMGAAEMVFDNTLSTIFDGVDEFGNIDTLVSGGVNLSTTTTGTWSCWVKPVDATPASDERFIAFGDTNANSHIIMYNDGTRLFANSRIAGVNQWIKITTVNPFSDSTWTHIALVQDGVSPILYVNAVAVGQSFIASLDTTVWFNDIPGIDNGRLANANFNSLGEMQFFNGNIDEPRFWNTNLSAAQIATHYNGGVPLAPSLEPLQANLITSYRMGDGDVFPTLTDNTNSNNGTLTNMESGDFEADVP